MGTGRRPEAWAMGMFELMVTDFPRSLAFWTGPLGFRLAFERPGADFACLAHPDGAQMMLYRRDGDWETGPLEPPFGRGAILQVYVNDAAAAYRALTDAAIPPYVPLREKWRDWGDRLGGQREFLVQDPDGYLVMVAERIGERPLPA